MRNNVFALLVFIMVSGCTSIEVKQLDGSQKISHVCIKKNSSVIVNGFVEVIEDGFQNHLITTEVYRGSRPRHCEYWLTYTALRSWDLGPYLSHAEIRFFRDNSKIGYAEYHLRGKGGLSLMKWSSVKSKMTPVMNKLLKEYK